MKKYALCSPLLPREIREEIERAGRTQCMEIPVCDTLPTPVNHHPDMLFFNPPNTAKTVLSKRYHAVNPHFFENFGTKNLILDDTALEAEYPRDIAFDAIGMGDTLYCLEAYTSGAVKSQFQRTVNVKQGYAACSTLILNETTAITADKSIAKALIKDGITVHTVSPEGIALPGYGCGFIGGASAVINGTAIFFGSLKSHPDGERIAEICHAVGIKPVDFPHLPLTDYGSVRYIYYN